MRATPGRAYGFDSAQEAAGFLTGDYTLLVVGGGRSPCAHSRE